VGLVSWWSDRDGLLGFGPSANVALSAAGPHTIEARARADTGERLTDAVRVFVGADPLLEILSPQDGAEAGARLDVRASSLDPATGEPLPDSQLRWWLRVPHRESYLVGQGHVATVDLSPFPPGDYRLAIEGQDDSGEFRSWDAIDLVRIAGQPPTVRILDPAHDHRSAVDGEDERGRYALVRLRAATSVGAPAAPGDPPSVVTCLWTTSADDGAEETLSHSCDDTVRLYTDGSTTTRHRITVNAREAPSGRSATDRVDIEIVDLF
jgi:hypothetical protein